MIEWRLHIKMAEKRWRIADLAKASGVSRETIRKLYNGKAIGVEMETLNRLCKALECQPGDLMVYVPDKERL
ncbi:helix-turn-helix domain-containing protein [Thermoanaerobacter uzonensis]|uniref:helix-turn-helix domain-containing protein n=1 Tax=Thermoanaerobacter uzonensis TaxID=447593 RepID=UPI003D7690C9